MEFTNQRKKQYTSEDIDKKLPQAIELEEAILGALLLDKDAITDIVDVLTPESFYATNHIEIYAAIIDLFRNAEGIDIITVTEKLRQLGKLEIIGGASTIVNLTTKVNSAANIEYHAHLLVQYAMKRGMIAVASKMKEEAYEDTTDIFALLDEMEQALFEIASSNIRKSVVSMKDVVHEALSELENRKNKEDGLTGIPSGFSDLDRVTSGWQKTDLVIIAARPAMGKTAFVLSMARNAAIDFETPIAFFSLEMSAVQLVNRIISAECELESEKIKKGTLTEGEWDQLHRKVPALSDAKIFIDDTPGLPVLELRAKARRLKAQHDIQVIVIDYLQLMTAGDVGRGNREQEIAYISRSLKGLAKELDVCVIALSQLSRAVETRGGDKKPQLSDLRESGAIEQDADMVCFLYRPEYYQITEYEDGSSTAGIGELIIAKHRNGSLETVKMRFLGQYIKFVNLNDSFLEADNFAPSALPSTDFVSDFEQPTTTILQSKLNNNSNTGSVDDDPPF